MSAIWESANWTRQFGIRKTGNRQFGMLLTRRHPKHVHLHISEFDSKIIRFTRVISLKKDQIGNMKEVYTCPPLIFKAHSNEIKNILFNNQTSLNSNIFTDIFDG